MANERDPHQYLNQFVAEHLPNLVPGIFETAGDPPSFAEDLRYSPLHDPKYPPYVI
jgi:hypothetical protein